MPATSIQTTSTSWSTKSRIRNNTFFSHYNKISSRIPISPIGNMSSHHPDEDMSSILSHPKDMASEHPSQDITMTESITAESGRSSVSSDIVKQVSYTFASSWAFSLIFYDRLILPLSIHIPKGKTLLPRSSNHLRSIPALKTILK